MSKYVSNVFWDYFSISGYLISSTSTILIIYGLFIAFFNDFLFENIGYPSVSLVDTDVRARSRNAVSGVGVLLTAFGVLVN